MRCFFSLSWRTEKFVLAVERNVGKVKNLPIRWRTLVCEVRRNYIFLSKHTGCFTKRNHYYVKVLFYYVSLVLRRNYAAGKGSIRRVLCMHCPLQEGT